MLVLSLSLYPSLSLSLSLTHTHTHARFKPLLGKYVILRSHINFMSYFTPNMLQRLGAVKRKGCP